MAVAGIIAEYNPFHTGHQRLIRQVRQRLGEDTPVVAAMTGNWAQKYPEELRKIKEAGP